MPVKLSDLRNKSRKIKIPFGEDGDLQVTIFPHLFTNELQRRYEGAAADGDTEGMAAEFRKMVTEWDLLGDDGNPLPMDGESFDTVGLPVFNEIFEEIGKLISPKSRQKNGRS